MRRGLSTVLITLFLTSWTFLKVPVPTVAAESCGVRVSAPADLQARLNAAGSRTVCLSGTFNTQRTIYPSKGQTIIGGTLRYTGTYRVAWERQDVMVDGYDLRAGNVTLENVTVLGFEGRGVVCADGATIRGSTLNDNRRNAVGCYAHGEDWYVRIIGNRMDHNGSRLLERHSSGAVKLLAMSKPGHPLGAGGLVEGNTITNSIGNGIWWDRTSSAGIARNNSSNGATHSGIRCERCGGPFLFEGNTVRNSNWDGIGARNTAKIMIRNNVLAGNGRDLNVSYGGADFLTYPRYVESQGYHPYDVVVQDTRLMAGRVLGCGIVHVKCSR